MSSHCSDVVTYQLISSLSFSESPFIDTICVLQPPAITQSPPTHSNNLHTLITAQLDGSIIVL